MKGEQLRGSKLNVFLFKQIEDILYRLNQVILTFRGVSKQHYQTPTITTGYRYQNYLR